MTDTLLISELASRSGFSPSALRYYERVGLLASVGRAPNGYRFYDDSAVTRLRFIERAKQLGLPLEEIRDLVTVWDDGACAHVRDPLHTHVLAKFAEVRDRIGELTAFAAQLDEARTELEGPSAAGGCDAACGCAEPRTDQTAGPQLVTLGATRRRSPTQTSAPGPVAVPGAVPVACTLAEAGQQVRLQQWRAELDHVEHRERIEGGLRLHFQPGPGRAGRLAELAVQEQACCSFLTFAVRPGTSLVVLDVFAPDDATDVLEDMFGVAS